ncbi:putative aromatic acid decarboxylase [Peptococcaceae bacterium CEB3]|nr:putative aromatic acid decarboxylase [Peptococcaceae bacterium CEB3]
MTKRLVVGITGASGSFYAYSLLRTLVSLDWLVEGIVTPMGKRVFAYECGVPPERAVAGVHWQANDDLFSSLASGSFRTEGMIVIPCSMNTLGFMAQGSGDSLLLRAAQVTLKERRPLIVVPREMPYNIIQLENMLRLARAGAIILPASPGFYHHPEKIEDLVDHVVGRVLDQLGIEHTLYRRWNGGMRGD